MIALMYGARSRVVLTSPYVIPSEPFLVAMCSTARRGVTVDLIVDQESNKPLVQLAQQSYYDTMLKAGVAIHRHTGSFLHAKHMSVDDDVALIGSSNLDIRSFALNAEVSVLIYDRTVVADLRRIQEGYLQHTSRVTLDERRAYSAAAAGDGEPGAPYRFAALANLRRASMPTGLVVSAIPRCGNAKPLRQAAYSSMSCTSSSKRRPGGVPGSDNTRLSNSSSAAA